MKRILTILLVVITFLLASYTNANIENNFNKKIDLLINKYDLNEAKIGISLINIKTGNSFSVNGDQKLIPASNLKLVTTATAYCQLGRDYEVKTDIYLADGKLTGNTYTGYLVVKGYGDPTISGRFYNDEAMYLLKKWSKIIKQQKIKIIAKGLCLDNTYFKNEQINPNWPKDQLSYWYCAKTSAISFNDNCIDVILTPNNNNNSLDVKLYPLSDYFQINNNCKITQNIKKHNFSITRERNSDKIKIEGLFYIKGNEWKEFITVDNPADYFGKAFIQALKDEGVNISDEIKYATIDKFTQKNLIISHITPLIKIINVANVKSQNLFAEQLVKIIGAEIMGSGERASGLKAIHEFLKKNNIISNDINSFNMDDGSGLSRQNKVKANTIALLLKYMAINHKSYFKLLPKAGEEGTLKKRMKKEIFKDKIYAKSGYINKVSALSGYIVNNEQPEWCFSIIVNDYKTKTAKAKKFQEELLETLIIEGTSYEK